MSEIRDAMTPIKQTTLTLNDSVDRKNGTADLPVAPFTSLFPTETEIYLLPNGEIVVADMPAELAERLQKIGLTLNAE
ncbi:MAG: hypothetical protein AAF702_25520 [Chloroflexota bacterium]